MVIMLLGIHMQILMGPSIAIPVTADLIQSVKSVEVTNTTQGRNGFQITFSTGRSDSNVSDYSLVNHPSLGMFNRVQIVIYFDLTPQVLVDGIITNKQFQPNNEPGRTTLVVTGDDVSYVMEKETRTTSYPNLPTKDTITTVLSSYPELGFVLDVSEPSNDSSSSENDVVHMQRETDLDYLQSAARRNHFVFYIEPSSVPGQNKAYWGPNDRNETLKDPISVNMGPNTNVTQIHFTNNNTQPKMIRGFVMDRHSNQIMPVQSLPSTRTPYSTEPSWLVNVRDVQTRQLVADGGLDFSEAMNQAQAEFENSVDCTLTATGTLDPARYGSLIRTRRKVKVRGTGDEHDGLYDVKSVTTTIRRGSIAQNFVLCREGTGSTLVNVN